MKVKAYIHSLKDTEHDRHVLGEAEIIKCIGDNLYLAEYNGVQCTAIFNFFTGAYYLLTALYNAPVTMGPYYSAAVRHDFG